MENITTVQLFCPSLKGQTHLLFSSVPAEICSAQLSKIGLEEEKSFDKRMFGSYDSRKTLLTTSNKEGPDMSSHGSEWIIVLVSRECPLENLGGNLYIHCLLLSNKHKNAFQYRKNFYVVQEKQEKHQNKVLGGG